MPLNGRKNKDLQAPPRGWRFGVRVGGWEGGSPGHRTLVGHTDQSEAYSVSGKEEQDGVTQVTAGAWG